MKWFAIIILAFSFSSYADEVTSFEDRPAVVEEGGKTYVGILVSEESYRESLKKAIDHAAEKANCAVDKRVCTHLQETYKVSIKNQQRQTKSKFEKTRKQKNKKQGKTKKGQGETEKNNKQLRNTSEQLRNTCEKVR